MADGGYEGIGESTFVDYLMLIEIPRQDVVNEGMPLISVQTSRSLDVSALPFPFCLTPKALLWVQSRQRKPWQTQEKLQTGK